MAFKLALGDLPVTGLRVQRNLFPFLEFGSGNSCLGERTVRNRRRFIRLPQRHIRTGPAER
ncbi:hypothetical protein [Streptomyces sp.]|uniref:hypothetical protein n=1 Tax=Streptomyces sp. TaxID=1931 RepID=UPI00281150EF|nr:hypothetical protein [Streptomyces sp.]